MSALARQNGWRGFDDLGQRVERGGFGHEPKTGGWMYSCDGMPWITGCGQTVIVPRRWTRVGIKKSGWMVCYGLESKPGTRGELDDPSQWEEDHDIVLTFCPRCAVIVKQQDAERGR